MAAEINDRFIPAIDPPEAVPSEALCFAFRRYDLLVNDHDGAPRIGLPTMNEMRDIGMAPERPHFLGHWQTQEGALPCYATDLGDEVDAPTGMTFLGLRPLFGRSDESLFQIAGRAVQIIDWDRTHQYCSRCGTPTQDQPHERARICPNCGLTSYPRLAPAIIVRVQRIGSDSRPEILLARNKRYPGGMYSVLAGFVEPGETLEECVAREVGEEVGIAVTNISYFGSQPWPFPHSLMIAFTADHASGELAVDNVELEEAYWFSADSLPKTPPPPSIANRLISNWLSVNT